MSDLSDKFCGPENRATLIRALRMMNLVDDSKALAEDIADHAAIVCSQPGETVIVQSENDDDMHFILAGKLQVLVDNEEIALLGVGNHVGELALIDPRAVRSATVRALRESVTAKLSEEELSEMGRRHPFLWRRMSQVLGDRLRAESRHVRLPNPRPKVFLTASPAGLAIAQALQGKLQEADLIATTWLAGNELVDDQIPLRGLEESSASADFGMVVVAPGDSARGDEPRRIAPRERLFLQCGICLGGFGASRCVILAPEGLTPPLESEALGLPTLTYSLGDPQEISASLDALSRNLVEAINRLGPR